MKKTLCLLALLMGMTACQKFVVGPNDEARWKKTNGNSWGIPQIRLVSWGFTGIQRDCTDCPAHNSKK